MKNFKGFTDLSQPISCDLNEPCAKSNLSIIYGILKYTLTEFPNTIKMIEFYDSRSIEEISNNDFFTEVCWIIYSSGFRFDIVKKYWSSIREAFHQFELLEVASWSQNLESEVKRVCNQSGFKNRKKAKWCIQNAQRILDLDDEMVHFGGLNEYLIKVSKKDTVELIRFAPTLVKELKLNGIGKTTIFHLMKNLGFKIFKPDIHVRRILTKLGLINCEDAPILEIGSAMLYLSRISQIGITELDTLLFTYGRLTGDVLAKRL